MTGVQTCALPISGVEETLLLADWALDAGARIVEVDGGKEGAARVLERLSWPVGAAARHRRIIDSCFRRRVLL